MPYGDLARIRTNLGALNAINALNYVNRELMTHQLRLATGKRINTAGEGPTEYSISKDLEGTARRWRRSLMNVQDAYSLYSTAESGNMAVKDMLIRMSELATQAASDLLSRDDRTKIEQELEALATEIDNTVDQTQWRGRKLLDGTYSVAGANRVWVGPTTSTVDALNITIGAGITGGIYWSRIAGITIGEIDVGDSTKAMNMLARIITALATVDKVLSEIGTFQQRLTIKETRIAEHETDVWASYSRIINADMAYEQLKVTTYTILQQAAVAGLAQANTAPTFILGLLGG